MMIDEMSFIELSKLYYLLSWEILTRIWLPVIILLLIAVIPNVYAIIKKNRGD